ncbi:hypothetical protein ACFO5K_16090 [Nocardia halotolerans]|uniref:N-acetyltransferase domain-containing protein n=1 Tax=Nocardia halotolerans TaxID=1755878 RepID=A0ABV8VHU5_9NOCA
MRLSIPTDPVGDVDAGGLRYHDFVTGCTAELSSPADRPATWRRYTEGALKVYRHYGVESALDYQAMRSGLSTTMFLVVTDAGGAVVGGLRAQGPHPTVEEVDGFGPWRATAGEDAMRSAIAERVPEGLVEIKAVWSDRTAHQRAEIGALLSRGVVHIAWRLRARHAFVTTAVRGVERYESSGGRRWADVPGVVYPDERYFTVPMSWDLTDELAPTPRQRALIAVERRQLVASENGLVADSDGVVRA